MVRSEV